MVERQIIPTYLDCAATTPLAPGVRDTMERWLAAGFGNASSRDHSLGWDAAEAVEDARLFVASASAATPPGVTFVSGATEACNMVVRGYIGYDRWTTKKIVTVASEHDAVLAPVRYLTQRTGVASEVLSVDRHGRADLESLRASLRRSRGALVAIMAANNEIGTWQPVRAIADVVHEAGGLFLCDTTQAFGKRRVNILEMGVDFATVSAHKIHGPKGIGALVAGGTAVKNMLDPLICGGAQESGLRGGTLNVAGIAGLGEACRLVDELLDEDVARMTSLRDRLEERILAEVPATWINGDRADRICNTSNMGFKSIDARTMIRDMHDIAVSTRSACSSGDSGPSHVLKAIGLSDEDAFSCIRFSLGRFTTQEEIDYTIEKVVTSAHKLRTLKSLRAD